MAPGPRLFVVCFGTVLPWRHSFVFLLIVAVCLPAPSTRHGPGIDPFKSTSIPSSSSTGKTAGDGTVNRRSWSWLHADRRTWELGNYFLGADNQGRDVMARLLYGGLNSLIIAGAATIFTLFSQPCLGFRRFLRRDRHVYCRASSTSSGLSRLSLRHFTFDCADCAGHQHRSDHGRVWLLWLPIFIIGIVYIPYIARPVRGQVMACAKANSFSPPSVLACRPPHPAARHPAQCFNHAHRLHSDHDGPQHADGIRTLFPLDRRAASGRQLGYDHSGWPTLLYTRPLVALAPGIAIVITVLALNVLGDGLRDALIRAPRSGSVAADDLRAASSPWPDDLRDVRHQRAGLPDLLRTPGVDPAARIAGRNATPEVLAAVGRASASISLCMSSTSP